MMDGLRSPGLLCSEMEPGMLLAGLLTRLHVVLLAKDPWVQTG